MVLCDGQFILLLPVGVGIVAVYIFRRLVMLLRSRRPRLRRRYNGTAVAPAARAAPSAAAAYIRRRRISRPLVPVRPVFTVTFVAKHDTAAGAAGPARRPRAARRPGAAGRPAALLTGTHTVTHGHEGGHTFSSVLGLKRKGKEW